MGGWKIARLVLCVFAVIQGMIAPFLHELIDLPKDAALSSIIPLPWSLLLIVIPMLFFPIVMLFAIGIQASNPFSAVHWTHADWDSNFLSMSDPLHFFHFGAYEILCCGIGAVLTSPFAESRVWIEGLSWISSGIGLLLGIKLCERCFPQKFKSAQPKDGE